VKIQHQQSQHRQHRQRWLAKPLSAKQFQHWLIDSGSLTKSLQQKYANFAVKPVAVNFAKAVVEEAALLRLPTHKTALIREVLLFGNNRPVVFAHSVLPRASLRGAWNGLGRLGNKPLGATLFANAKVKRTPLSYKKLSKNHVLYRRALKNLAATQQMVPKPMQAPTFLWARRSIFSLNCATILVTEIFLPALLGD
jgi:chorismate lyase